MRFAKRQLMFTVVIAAVIGVLLIAFFVYAVSSIFYKQEQQTKQYLNEISNQSRAAIVNEVEGNFETLLAMSTLVGEMDTLDSETLLPLFMQISQECNYKRTGYIDTQGRCVIAQQDGSYYVGVDFSQREYVQHALAGETYVSDMFEDALEDGWLNAYSVPIWEGEEVVGALAVTLDAVQLTKTVDDSLQADNGTAFIVHSNGTLVAYYTQNQNIITTDNIFYGDMLTGEQAQEVMRNMQAMQGGSLECTLPSGERYWGSYTPVGIRDWFVVSMLPESAINQRFTVVNDAVIALGLVVVLCIGVLVVYTANTRRGWKNTVWLAYYDQLTGLYNANRFAEMAGAVVKAGQRPCALVLLDIKNFKFVNELCGYAQGDALLCHVADVLRTQLADNEVYCREADDRFALLLCYQDDARLERRLWDMAAEIKSFPTSRQQLNIGCNCGVKRIGPDDAGAPFDTRMDRARLALRWVKRSGASGSIVFYDETIMDSERQRHAIESTMEAALDNEEFQVYLQPKVRLADDQLCGAEALVRWRTSDQELLPPIRFVPVFEQNGFIARLDAYMLRKVCALLRGWMDAGLPPVPIAVNQSRHILYSKGYIDQVRATLRQYDVPPGLILIEVTETVAAQNTQTLIQVIAQLHGEGVLVSMDDFGSGYSSFNLLESIPIDELKLDKGFLENKGDSQKQQLIVRAVLQLAEALGIETIAEGVEVQAQADFLRDAGCKCAQGYLYAKPMEARQFEAYLKK